MNYVLYTYKYDIKYNQMFVLMHNHALNVFFSNNQSNYSLIPCTF